MWRRLFLMAFAKENKHVKTPYEDRDKKGSQKHDFDDDLRASAFVWVFNAHMHIFSGFWVKKSYLRKTYEKITK